MRNRALAFLTFSLLACGGPGVEPPDEDLPVVPGDGAEDFVSHVAGQSSDEGTADAGAAPPEEDGARSGDAERAIAEADIIQMDGDRLYALSRYAGMHIIDVSDPASLRVLGRHRTAAVPSRCTSATKSPT